MHIRLNEAVHERLAYLRKFSDLVEGQRLEILLMLGGLADRFPTAQTQTEKEHDVLLTVHASDMSMKN